MSKNVERGEREKWRKKYINRKKRRWIERKGKKKWGNIKSR
jgi:hypothetical protein